MSLKTKPEPVQLRGNPLKCTICAHEAFHRRKTHFDAALSQDMNPEWKDVEGYCLICDRCGYIHWFLDR